MSVKKPKVLFLAGPFPPCPTVGGIRKWNVARYLARSGWNVTVVTPHPSIWRYAENIEETNALISRYGIQRILTDHSWRCLNPGILRCRNNGLSWVVGGVCRRVAQHLGIDDLIGFAKAADRACSTLTSNDVDVILATGAPFSSFSLAKRLSDRLGRPYVLDYRDPWTRNMHAVARVPKWVIREETRLLAGCAAATVVSPSWAKAMEESSGIGSKLHVITNGYDPEEIEKVQPFNFPHFSIVYTGVFYPPKRVISPFMSALRDLKTTLGDGGPPWFFHYYGAEEAHVREEAVRFGVIDKVVLHGRVPRQEALSAVKGANLAVVISSVSNENSFAEMGMIPAKVYEALGLRTPILLVGPARSDAAEIVRGSRTGAVFSGCEPKEISKFLYEIIHGQIQFNRSSNVQDWAWPQLICRFDSVLKGAIQ